MSGCEVRLYTRPGEACGEPGLSLQMGCRHEHILEHVLCDEHAWQVAGNARCGRCEDGPEPHRCVLSLLPSTPPGCCPTGMLP